MVGEIDVVVALLISQSTNLYRDYQAATSFIGAALDKAIARNPLPALEHTEYSN